jgi:hypothetical protein
MVPGLGACQEDLLRFGRKSDEDFTALARGLGALNQHLSTLRTQAEQLEVILEDRDEDHAVSSATALYKSSVDLVHASMGTALSEQDQIKGIEERLTHACKARDSFKRNHLLLRILTMTVRMEASRMTADYQGVFLNVAAAISEIGEKIATDTETAFERIGAVIAEARTERHNLQHLEQSLLGRAHDSIQRIERELESLKVLLLPCVEQSRGIGKLFSEVGPTTLRTLASLQHQDIVRQQLEHVAAGFDDIRRHLQESRSPGHEKAKVEIDYVHHAASVQKAHLHTARIEIETAAEEVTAGLRAVLAVGDQLLTDFTAMETAGKTAFQDCHVAQLFRDEIGQLASIADMSEKANDKISGLVERIAEVVRVFSQEISHHELDVKIVALNAQIAAARLPSADALNKLAEETSIISTENAQVTRDLVADLQTSLDSLMAVKRDADEFLEIVTSEKTELERGVLVVGDRLARLGERVQSKSSEVRREFEVTHRESAALLENLKFPSLVARCFEPAELLCERLLSATASHADPKALSAEASARLESHRERYTMRKESATHANALTTVAAASVAPQEIELFGPGEPPPASRSLPAEPADSERANGNAVQSVPVVSASEAGAPPASPAPHPNATVAPPPAGSSGFGDGIELF